MQITDISNYLEGKKINTLERFRMLRQNEAKFQEETGIINQTVRAISSLYISTSFFSCRPFSLFFSPQGR